MTNARKFRGIDRRKQHHAIGFIGSASIICYIEKERKLSATIADTKTCVLWIYDLYVFQEKAAVPSQYIEVYDGHYVNMKHNENYKNLTACNLTGPKVC